MTVLQIASYESCGKTALCAGIGKKLINAGKKVGYIKPINMTGAGHKVDCKDAAFVNEALELGEVQDQMCPFNLSQEELWRRLSEDTENFADKLKTACDSVAAGRDVTIVESPGSLRKDQVSALACYTLAEELAAKVILVVCYTADYREPEITQIAGKLGEKLIGIVLNQVPASRLRAVKADCESFFQAEQIRVLGVLPESRSLVGISVSEIASALDAEIISSSEKANDLVENVMLGAMTPDSAKGYYDRRRGKAVIARAERPDMHLAALDTPMKCLIVTGNRPSAPVLVKAEDKKVPVLVVNKDVNEIVAGLERALAQAKFQHSQKLSVLASMLEDGFDFKTLNSALGL